MEIAAPNASAVAHARQLLRLAAAIASGDTGAVAHGQALLRGDHAPAALPPAEPELSAVAAAPVGPVANGRRRRRTGGLL